MTLIPETLDDINYWDLDMFVTGSPHAAWCIQREQSPVWWHDKPGGEPFWSITRFDDCRTVLGDPRTFSSASGIMLLDDNLLANPGASVDDFQPMILTDPPRHQPLRRTISHNFTPRAIAKLEQEIRSYAEDCLAEAADRREVDFVADIAHRIPAAIALSLMGVPRDRWDRLAELEHQAVTRNEPEFWDTEDQNTSLAAAQMEMYGYFAELVQQRVAEPGEDLLSQVVQGEVLGEPLPWMQAVAEAGLLLAGGLDTTRAAGSEGGMLPLLSHPDQLEALSADLSLLPSAVEEFVRWASPVTHEARTLLEDAEIGGTQMRAGDRLAIWSPSANRDEAHFPDPYRFDITRTPNRHLGYAYGEHYCLGVHLARLTLKVEFEELLKRFKSFELVGEPQKVRSNFVGGLKHLPMRLTPR